MSDLGSLLPDDVLLTPLSSSDVERMTLVSPSTQRVWRTRGYLEQLSSKRATFDVFAIAAIAIRYELSLQGRSPAETSSIGAQYAANVVYFTLMNTSGVCDLLALSDEKLKSAERQFLMSDDLISHICKLDSRIAPDRYIFISEPDRFASGQEVSKVQLELSARSGAFVDLELLAEHLGRQAGRPLVTLLYDGVTPSDRPPPRRRVIGSVREDGRRDA